MIRPMEARKRGFLSMRRCWRVGVLALAAGLFLMVAALQRTMEQSLAETTRLARELRTARIDLANGFLHLMLDDGQPGAFHRATGQALIDQAVSSTGALLDNQATWTNGAWLSGPIHDRLNAANADFDDECNRWLALDPDDPEQAASKVRLRTAYGQLERSFAEADAAFQGRLVELRRLNRAIYWTTLGVSALLTMGILVLLVATALSENRALRVLRNNEARLRALFDAAPTPMAFVDAEGQIVALNRRFGEVIGYRLDDMPTMAQWWPMAFPDAGRRFEARERWEAMAADKAGPETAREFAITCADANERSFLVSTRPLDGGLLIAFHDISERRQVEQALAASEGRFRQLAESIREVFWLADVASHRLIYVSPAYAAIWGRPVAEAEGAENLWMASAHQDDRDRLAHSAVITPDLVEYDIEYRILRPDGSVRWIHDRAFPIRNAAGEVYRVAGVAEDTTERRRIEEQYRHAQRMEGIGRLAGGIAHDFNNLLTVIQGNAALMAEIAQDDKDLGELAQQVTAASERAATLTRQLLLFSRKQALQPKPINLPKVVADTVRLLQRLVGEDVAVDTRCAPDTPDIVADEGMIEQVLMNLIVNARDAMPRGGRITVATRRHVVSQDEAEHRERAGGEECVLVEVADTGAGIAADVLPHIFEPFFTTKAPGKGTGLGLATVYSVVQQHRGWVEVDSLVGRGTTFRVVLPARALRPSSPASRPGSVDKRPLHGREGILVVEDETWVRRLVVGTLASHGYRVFEAESGPEALRVWATNREAIHLLLTDVVMPGGLNGFEVARRLRAEAPGLPVIYTSGYDADALDASSGEVPGARRLQKPYLPHQLADAVRQCLDQAPSPVGASATDEALNLSLRRTPAGDSAIRA